MSRSVRVVLGLVAAAGLVVGCQPATKESAAPATGSAVSAVPSVSVVPSPSVDVAANSTQVCATTLAVVKKHYVAMADDAIAAIDKPVSAKEAGAKVRGHYTALLADLRKAAPSAADPQVRAALETLASGVERHLAGPKGTQVEAPDLDPLLTALDTVCGR
ncbi:hypothetical protein [Micromonospora sp. NPDC005203]|uniref:hypothetical protein n=1 Tax=Micromonospora sp. NPDC005203 TaxID=3364226 RepID=UPI003687C13D